MPKYCTGHDALPTKAIGMFDKTASTMESQFEEELKDILFD